jgi:hypothetical protein
MGQRIRTIKPALWCDEEIRSCSRDARLLCVVLITFADDDGRWHNLPRLIGGFGYPEDDDATPRKITAWTDELAATGVLVRYEVNGNPYATFPNWHAHQRINRYTPSTLPPCPPTPGVVIVPHKSHDKLTDPSVNDPGVVTESSPLEGRQERGKGEQRISSPHVGSEGPRPAGALSLADKVTGVLQRGIDGIPTDEHCKHPSSTRIAALLSELGSDENVAMAVAIDARSITQAQGRAPNVEALYASKLRAAMAASTQGEAAA